jgi:hypothetical protein
VKKLIAVILSTAALLCTSAAFGEQSARLLGESLDSGLGNLPATYKGDEFMKRPAGYVAGEKQDSGLGTVSQEELQRIVGAYYQRR